VPRIGTLPLAVSAAWGPPSRDQGADRTHFDWPSLSGRQVLLFHASACDKLTPPLHRAPPGPQAGRSLAESTPRKGALLSRGPDSPPVSMPSTSFRCVSSGSHTFVFLSLTCPDHCRDVSATLTTPALNRRRLRWFGLSACTANPEGQPPSLAQHASCWRSPTSSPLHFQDTQSGPTLVAPDGGGPGARRIPPRRPELGRARRVLLMPLSSSEAERQRSGPRRTRAVFRPPT
jgi:hypothetical protein